MSGNNTPSDLGSLLSAVLTQRDWQRRLRLHQVFLFWDEVVGKEIAKHAVPQVIKGDVLWLSVSDSIWMQQLQFERHQLLELLNARLIKCGTASGQAENHETDARLPLQLRDIKFTLDTSIGRRQPRQKKKTMLQAIDHEQLAKFEASLNSIDSPEIRESMKRLWMVMHQRPRP